nr:hypothetical protein GCM10020093_040700 [Planobispora longispora]
MEGNRSHVVVVGAGIAGLAAAWHLRRGGEDIRVTVLDGAGRIGGKLHASEVAGVPVDAGAEAMLVRRPEGKDLARMVGLGDELRHPGDAQAAVLTRGALRPMPRGQVMGVPSDLAALASSGVLTPGGLARVPMDQILPATLITTDVSVAAYIRARMGGEVVDRLVEPILGGVYAGRAEALSLDATMPRIAAAARTERSLLAATKKIADEAPKDAGPVFATLRTGMGSLPEVVAAASGAEIRTGVMVRELRRTGHGWRLVAGPVPDPEIIEADAVILATPGPATGRLLADEVPKAAAELARIEYASMAVVTLAYPRAAFPRSRPGAATWSRRSRAPGQGRHVQLDQVAAPGRGGPRPDRAALLDRAAGRGGAAPAGRRRAGRPRHGRDGRGRRGARAAQGLPGDPLGRGPPAVQRGPPRPGRPHPGRRRLPARAGPVRRGLRRRRHPRLRRHRPYGGGPGPGAPEARGERSDSPARGTGDSSG